MTVPIFDIQRRFRELGRLRAGYTEGTRPVKSDTWRITSASRPILDRAAELWGGDIQEWTDAPSHGTQWELLTEADRLEVYVPPQPIAQGQYFELWKAGGCTRRCDTITELISGKTCRCDPEKRDCKITTHLLVILPDLPDIGVFRLTTHSYNAAVELPPAVELLTRQADMMARAVLRIDHRVRKDIENGKSTTKQFIVPVLEVPYSLGEAHQHGMSLSVGPTQRAALPGVPVLPDDPTFQNTRSEWGSPPALPGEASPSESANPPSRPSDGAIVQDVQDRARSSSSLGEDAQSPVPVAAQGVPAEDEGADGHVPSGEPSVPTVLVTSAQQEALLAKYGTAAEVRTAFEHLFGYDWPGGKHVTADEADRLLEVP